MSSLSSSTSSSSRGRTPSRAASPAPSATPAPPEPRTTGHATDLVSVTEPDAPQPGTIGFVLYGAVPVGTRDLTHVLDVGFPGHVPPRVSTIGQRDYTILRGRRSGQGLMAEITVRSELNAIVWKIEVVIGKAVGEGDTLMILESMKMEIPVAAPRAGTVKTLLVAEGEQVAEGQALAVLETGS